MKDITKDYKLDFISYPFLSEETGSCDHELLTDTLSSQLALISTKLKSFPKEQALINDLVHKVYHVNGSIRGKVAISEEDLKALHTQYLYYKNEVNDIINGFLLPTGSEISCHLHLARCKGKEIVRNMHKTERNGFVVNKILYDYMNLFSNLMFVLAVYINKCTDYKEIEFISKSY